MKLNLEKIAELEREHENDHIYCETLKLLLHAFISSNLSQNQLKSMLEYKTLKDMGIIIEDEKKAEILKS